MSRRFTTRRPLGAPGSLVDLTGDLKDKFRVIGEEDDPAEALEDLKRKKKAEHCVEIKFRAPHALRLRDGVEIYAIDATLSP